MLQFSHSDGLIPEMINQGTLSIRARSVVRRRVVRMKEMTKAHKTAVESREGNRPLERRQCVSEDEIKTGL
jgi:hypothetical protein